ncbi:MAG: DNA polymerase III subunit delta [Candidatus Omnitrophota bacterium]|jgi:DNA polymerase III delta subunit
MTSRFFLIIGDPFLRSQKIKSIVSDLEKKAKGSFDHQTYRLADTPLDSILSNARTLPFLASGQIFYIQVAEKLTQGEMEILKRYAMSPDEKTCLIFEIDSSEGHSELINLAKSRGKVVRLAKEEARSLAQNYLQQKLARFKKTITPGARQRILEMCGDAIVFLDTMLDRILQYSGEAQLIDENMVCLFEENWRGVNVFQLADAILERDRGKARQTFHELLENSESEPRFLIGIIHWQLRQLWQGAVLREAGTSEAEILEKVKVPLFKKGPFMSAINRYGVARLEAALEALHQLDRKTKTGLAHPVSGTETWIMEFVS